MSDIIGVPFLDAYTDFLILFIGFVFLEFAIKKFKKDFIFDDNSIELERILWFLTYGAVLYLLSIPLLSTLLFASLNNNLTDRIIFSNIRPELLAGLFNLQGLSNALVNSSIHTVGPLIEAISGMFATIITAIICITIVNEARDKRQQPLGLTNALLIYALIAYVMAALEMIWVGAVLTTVLLVVFVVIIFASLLINKFQNNKKAWLMLAIVIVVGLYISIFQPSLTEPFNVTRVTPLGYTYYLTGNLSNYRNRTGVSVPELQAYNQTAVFLNTTLGSLGFNGQSNFEYFKLQNATSLKEVNSLARNFTLPGMLINKYSGCSIPGLPEGYLCIQEDIVFNNKTISYLTISNITGINKNLFNTTAALLLGPQNNMTVQKIIRITSQGSTLNNASQLSTTVSNIGTSTNYNGSIILSNTNLPVPKNYRLTKIQFNYQNKTYALTPNPIGNPSRYEWLNMSYYSFTVMTEPIYNTSSVSVYAIALPTHSSLTFYMNKMS